MKRILFGALLLSAFFNAVFAQTQPPKANKTLTNADLEKFREARLKADAESEAERKRRGLPSKEEIERRQEIEAQKRRALSIRLENERAVKANFYLRQAVELRAELVSIDAQIEYVRARLREIPRPRVYYAINYLPFYNYYPSAFPSPVVYPNNSGATRGSFWIESGTNSRPSGEITFAKPEDRRQISPQPNGILVVPFTFPTYDAYTREELRANLRTLEQTRAGLAARFQLLADEAWQSGVRID